MASPDDDVQAWFDGLSSNVQEQLSQALEAQANALADAIREAAPERTGKLRESVRVIAKNPNEAGNALEFDVVAGGDLTSKPIRKGSSKLYDYALATEYGTTHENAEPFFFPTFIEMQDDIVEAIEEATDEAVKDS